MGASGGNTSLGLPTTCCLWYFSGYKEKVQAFDQKWLICDLQAESVPQRVPWRQCGAKCGRTAAAEEPSEKVKFSECVRTLGPCWQCPPEGNQSLLLARGIEIPVLPVRGDLCPARSSSASEATLNKGEERPREEKEQNPRDVEVPRFGNERACWQWQSFTC